MSLLKKCADCGFEHAIRPGAVFDTRCARCGPSAFYLRWSEKGMTDAVKFVCAICGQAFRFKTGLRSTHRCGGCKTGYLLTYISRAEREKIEEDLFPATDAAPLSVVIVCHNGLALTQRCLERIPENIERVVVDNGSTDGTANWLKAQKGIIGVRNRINLGCAIARNQGAAWASKPYLLFLDNDQFIPKGFCERALASCQDLAGVECWAISSGGMVAQSAGPVVDGRYIGAGGMIIRSEVFAALGGFDERFAPAWYADTDFSFRALQAGFKVGIIPNANIEHVRGGTITKQKTFDSESAKLGSLKLWKDIWTKKVEPSKPVRSIKGSGEGEEDLGRNKKFETGLPYKINFPLTVAPHSEQNKGPRIQAGHKQIYFEKFAKQWDLDVAFSHRHQHMFPDWTHSLFFPVDGILKPRTSYGPNFGGHELFGELKPTKLTPGTFKNKAFIADSKWCAGLLQDCFSVEMNQISVVPVYISEAFYEAKYTGPERFTVGSIGYMSDKGKLKNFGIIPELARRHPDWCFVVCLNRAPGLCDQELRSFSNITVLNNTPYQQMPELFAAWSCYLGISKFERGPAAIQEASVVGCPTVAPLHTGYAEFDPLVAIENFPAYTHPTEDMVDAVEDALRRAEANHKQLAEQAEARRHIIWQKRSPEVITAKWKQFFYRQVLGCE